jgi:hypothetical protein
MPQLRGNEPTLGLNIVILIVINKHIWCNNLDLSTIDYFELVNEGCCSL